MLSMTRPTKHPKTNIYQTRKVIPQHLRDIAKASLGVGHELKVSLGTKDEREALRKHPAALADIEAKLENLRGIAAGQTAPLNERQVRALAGQWYRAEAAKHDADPGTPKQWQDAAWVTYDQADQFIPDTEDPINPAHTREVTLTEDDRAEALRLLIEARLPALPQNIDRVAHAIWAAKMDLFPILERTAEGDWSPDPNIVRFPELLPAPPRAPQRPPDRSSAEPGLSFDDLLKGWARDAGLSQNAKPIPRPLYDRTRTLERLAAFLGHRDAAKVTKAEAVRWKESMQERELSVLTVRNDLSEMSALWKHALAQGKLGDSEINPFAGISPPKPKRMPKQRRAFTDAEAAKILAAARDQKGYMRWLPWVCCFTGARLSEICQAGKDASSGDHSHLGRQGDHDVHQGCSSLAIGRPSSKATFFWMSMTASAR